MLGGSRYVTDLVNPVLPSLVDSEVDIINLIIDLLAHALLSLTFCGCRVTTGLGFLGFQSFEYHAKMLEAVRP